MTSGFPNFARFQVNAVWRIRCNTSNAAIMATETPTNPSMVCQKRASVMRMPPSINKPIILSAPTSKTPAITQSRKTTIAERYRALPLFGSERFPNQSWGGFRTLYQYQAQHPKKTLTQKVTERMVRMYGAKYTPRQIETRNPMANHNRSEESRRMPSHRQEGSYA